MKAVQTEMIYVSPATKVAYLRRDAAGDDAPMEATIDEQRVEVEDLRMEQYSSPPMTLMKNGVELVKSPLEEDLSSIDFLDSLQVLENYYPECETLVRKALEDSIGTAPRVVRAFDHNIRIAQSENVELANGGGSKVQQPIRLVHGDYTAVSAPRRFQDLAQPPKINDVWRHRQQSPLLDPQLVQEGVLEKKRRFLIINVWRSMDRENPVTAFPLACVDATTVRQADLRTLQIHYADRIGENYLAVKNGATGGQGVAHRWVYWDAMTHDEALLIKQWDSIGALGQGEEQDGDISTLCLHSAFALPEQTSVRKSIEVRCVCIV